MAASVAQARGPLERLGLDPSSPWWGEHCARYRFAYPYVSGARVLDAACGTGFGARMLAHSGARTVVGIDLAPAALGNAPSANLPTYFACADGHALPFPDACFDAVTSFETIEHLAAPEHFLEELQRVLRRGGVLVLSTPNARITEHYPRNPFHLKEYYPEELAELLRSRFRDVWLFGQLPRPEFGVLPFLPGHNSAHALRGHAQALTWKLLNRCSPALREAVARLLWQHSFHPGEHDYQFDTDATARAHVTLAVCHRS